MFPSGFSILQSLPLDKIICFSLLCGFVESNLFGHDAINKNVVGRERFIGIEWMRLFQKPLKMSSSRSMTFDFLLSNPLTMNIWFSLWKVGCVNLVIFVCSQFPFLFLFLQCVYHVDLRSHLLCIWRGTHSCVLHWWGREWTRSVVHLLQHVWQQEHWEQHDVFESFVHEWQ